MRAAPRAALELIVYAHEDGQLRKRECARFQCSARQRVRLKLWARGEGIEGEKRGGRAKGRRRKVKISRLCCYRRGRRRYALSLQTELAGWWGAFPSERLTGGQKGAVSADTGRPIR